MSRQRRVAIGFAMVFVACFLVLAGIALDALERPGLPALAGIGLFLGVTGAFMTGDR